MLKVLDLFSGIGGFSLGLERTGGFETVAFCEIEKFPQKVLAKHWPGVPIYEDVRELTAERLRADGIIRQTDLQTQVGVDIITGGFPCQDISVAGRQAGIREGSRSSLFDEIIRLTRDIRPSYVVCENVAALLSGSRGEWFSYVLCEFSRIGYDVEWESISAQEVGAWHKRDRVWIMAYPNSIGEPSRPGEVQEKDGEVSERHDHAESNDSGGELSDTMQQRLQGRENSRSLEGSWENLDKLIARCSESLRYWDAEPELGRVANGIPDRSHRLKGLGNAVVPQIPELIGRAILDAEANT